jgi:hypothetical protein
MLPNGNTHSNLSSQNQRKFPKYCCKKHSDGGTSWPPKPGSLRILAKPLKSWVLHNARVRVRLLPIRCKCNRACARHADKAAVAENHWRKVSIYHRVDSKICARNLDWPRPRSHCSRIVCIHHICIPCSQRLGYVQLQDCSSQKVSGSFALVDQSHRWGAAPTSCDHVHPSPERSPCLSYRPYNQCT